MLRSDLRIRKMYSQVKTSSFSSSPKSVISAALLGLAVGSQPTTAAPHISSVKRSTAEAGFYRLASARSAQGTGRLDDSDSFLAGWQGSPIASEWHFEIASEMRALASKPDGWKGADSHSASISALHRAQDLLWKLSVEKVERRPAVGLDHEGTFSFMWMDDEISADLTVYEDGTYSFFAKGPNSMAMVDDASIAEPLDRRLLSVLLS